MPVLFVLGATSDMARATALRFARDGWDCLLAGRNPEALERVAKDIAARTGRQALPLIVDVLHCTDEQRRDFWRGLPQRPAALLCAVGVLGDQKTAEQDPEEAGTIFAANFTALAPWLELAAAEFEQAGQGSIIGIGSVAGDRGRKSNYVYGSAKAGFAAYLSGLRNRLAASGVRVLTVKPGFVRTAMTRHMKLPDALTASTEQVAEDIFKAAQGGKDVIYTRWFWRLIMLIIRSIPERIFKKLSL